MVRTLRICTGSPKILFRSCCQEENKIRSTFSNKLSQSIQVAFRTVHERHVTLLGDVEYHMRGLFHQSVRMCPAHLRRLTRIHARILKDVVVVEASSWFGFLVMCDSMNAFTPLIILCVCSYNRHTSEP